MKLPRPSWTGWPARGLLAAIVVRILIALAGSDVRSLIVVGLLELAANLAIAIAAGYGAIVVLVLLLRRLLWRVRRKLMLSYVFIGLIPVVLIVGLFLLTGTLTLLSVSSYMVKSNLDDLVREARIVAAAAAGELDGRPDADAGPVLARHHRSLAARGLDAGVGSIDRRPARGGALTAGNWLAARRPERLPRWLGDGTFEGLVAVGAPDGVRIVARAVQPVGAHGSARVVIVDLPVDGSTAARIRRETGADVQGGAIVAFDAGTGQPSDVAPIVTPDPLRARHGRRWTGQPSDVTPIAALASDESDAVVSARGIAWFTFLEHTDWESGEIRFLRLGVRVPLLALYQRVFGAQARIGDVGLGYLLLAALAAVAALFLVIELAALVMGLALARSITGAVHELSVGTRHVRRGDFEHRIRVRARDQLGELAESFNTMTASVRDLLQQVGAKKRLEEELRIARDVQMSLLPRDTAAMPGLEVTAACVPAREVGGDYYDFIRLGDRRIGVLVADVSGKGTSAAFYMAELKGLIASLGPIHPSPKRLLVEVNRIVTRNIDASSFITMAYAVIDLERGTLTCARAGHTPLVHLPGGDGRPARLVAPDGLIAGLDGFEQQFEEILEEDSFAIATGDVVALFTDGVTEAMNVDDELFGEQRLARTLEAHRESDLATLRREVLGSIDAFVGAAEQHDDMTMVLLKIGGGAAG